MVIEHGGGSGSAYPIARDVMTFLFDPQKGLDALRALEQQWGGSAQQRLEQRYAAYAVARGASVKPPPRREEEIFDQVEAEARLAARQSEAIATDAIKPRGETSSAATPPGPVASPPIDVQASPITAPSPAPVVPETTP